MNVLNSMIASSPIARVVDQPATRPMSTIARVAIALACTLSGTGAFAQADPWADAERKAGPAKVISSQLREEAWFVPGGPGQDGRPVLLRARVFRPVGAGPFKVAVISHGSPASAAARPKMSVPRYNSATAWLLERGYIVVLPLRRGYGGQGEWAEDYGTCNGANYVAAGTASADDIVSAAGYLATLPEVRRNRILLMGVSAGGFGTLAAVRRNTEGVFAAINFSGGRGGHQGKYGDENFAPGNLVKAAAAFGVDARVPSLWLYAKNDSFFDPDLSRRMFEAYKGAGGRVQYVLFPEFKKDGHAIFGDAEGKAVWRERVASFLQGLE